LVLEEKWFLYVQKHHEVMVNRKINIKRAFIRWITICFANPVAQNGSLMH